MSAIIANFDFIFIGISIGIIGMLAYPKFIVKVKKDGMQISDITEAVCEGATEYKEIMSQIEQTIDDVTVNDADTLAFIKSSLQTLKTFK